MLATCVSYLIITVPAVVFEGADGGPPGEAAAEAARVKWWALAGLLVSAAAFAAYSAYCVLSASKATLQEAKALAVRKAAVASKLVSFGELLKIEAAEGADAEQHDGHRAAAATLLEGGVGASAFSASVKRLFARFDVDGSGSLDHKEVRMMLRTLGLPSDRAAVSGFLGDEGGADKLVQVDEFEAYLRRAYEAERTREGEPPAADAPASSGVDGALSLTGGGEEGAGEEEDEEEEEEEDEARGRTPWQIKREAYGTLAAGIVLVTVFSDPMVDVLSELGTRLNIPAFYVSFLITPFVSNASEMISSIMQATKKKKASLDVTYSQLLGAATMNNTFVLSIFLVLVFARGLVWEFTAEIATIIFVQVAIGALVLTDRNAVTPLWKGIAAGCLYPLSLVLVWVLENVAGWD
jgi:Ca2+/Na+ antiporter